ncbi:hypothetical protein [Candidatus Nitrososphaera gargensis]|nr:hypothetical protein [Candidatus Nitrososphaera gargensis]
MMEVISTQGTFTANVEWIPADIGQPNNFSFNFRDGDGQPVTPAYDVELLRDNQMVPGTLRESQTSLEQEYTFNEAGNYTLRIHNVQTKHPGDVINIPLQVPPE